MLSLFGEKKTFICSSPNSLLKFYWWYTLSAVLLRLLQDPNIQEVLRSIRYLVPCAELGHAGSSGLSRLATSSSSRFPLLLLLWLPKLLDWPIDQSWPTITSNSHLLPVQCCDHFSPNRWNSSSISGFSKNTSVEVLSRWLAVTSGLKSKRPLTRNNLHCARACFRPGVWIISRAFTHELTSTLTHPKQLNANRNLVQ